MNKIFLYTTMYTGTVFTRLLLETAYDKKYILNMTRAKISRKLDFREDFPLEDLLIKFWSCFTKEEIKCTKLAILSTHRGAGAPGAYTLFDKLLTDIPEIPFVTTIRDPLLTANAHYWRSLNIIGRILSKEERQIKIETITSQLLGFLSIPEKHCFKLPVDLLKTSHQKTRIAYLKELFNHCNLLITRETKNMINEWPIVNPTSGKNKDNYSITKRAIINKDINIVKKNLNLELDFLRKQKELKHRLFDMGYRNLLWWH